MDYLQDDDDSQDELEANAPASSVPPASSQALKDYLQQRLQQADTDAAAQKAKQQQATGINSDIGFMGLLANSAAQAGTLGGKMASAKPVTDYGDQLQGGIQNSLKQDEQDKLDKDKLNNYLLDKSNQQDMLQQKLDAGKSTAQIKADADLAKQKDENKTKVTVAQLGADKKRYSPVGSDDDGNLIVMDMQTGKLRNTDQTVSKIGGPDNGTNPKDNKRLDDLGVALSTGGRSNQDFRAQQQVVTNADKILQMEPQAAAQKGGLDKRQVHELAIASANLLSSGSGAAQATVEALVPHSIGTSAASIEEWLSSEPQGTNQQAFVNRMFDTANREKHLAGEKLNAYRSTFLNNYGDLAGNPRYEDMKKRNLPPDAQFDEQGNYKPKPFGMQDLKPQQPGPVSGGAVAAPGQKLDPRIDAWSKTHSMDYGAARKILMGRGYQPNEQ